MILDVSKTGGHFSGASEMYGTSISEIELDNSTYINNRAMINGRMTTKSHNTSNRIQRPI